MEIYRLVKELEEDVLTRFRTCDTLKQINVILDDLRHMLDPEIVERLDQIRHTLADKVDQARHGFIVARKPEYNHLISEMEKINSTLLAYIEKAHILAE